MRRSRIALIALLSSAFSAASLPAASVFWDGNDITANADGGAGAWNTAGTNWDTLAIGGTNTTFVSGVDTANFGGVGGAVVLDNATTVPVFNVTTGGYSFSGSALTVGSFNIGAGYTASFTNSIVASGGTLVINNGIGGVVNTSVNNTIATLNINTGTFRAAAGTSVSSNAAINIGIGGSFEMANTNAVPANATAADLNLTGGFYRMTGGTHSHLRNISLLGGIIDMRGGSYNGESIQLNGNVTAGSLASSGTSWIVQSTGDNTNRGLSLAAGTRTFTVNDNSELRVQSEIEAADSGVGNLIKAGAGRMTLLNTSSYTGSTTINAGILQIGDNSVAGTGSGITATSSLGGVAVPTTINIASGATLRTYHQGGNTYLANIMTGAGTIQTVGFGALALSGNANTFTGTVDIRSIEGLTLDYTTNNNDKLGATAAVTLNGGKLQLTGNAAAATAQSIGALSINGGGSIFLNNATGFTLGLTAASLTRSNNGLVTFQKNTAGAWGTDATVTITGGGTLGRWATIQTTGGTVATLGLDTAFATLNGSNVVVPVPFAQESGALDTDATDNIAISTATPGGIYLSNTAQTLTNNLTLDSLATSANLSFAAGTEQITLTGGGLILRNPAHTIGGTTAATRGVITTGLASGELLITASGAVNNATTLNSSIINNGATPTILVKGGDGQINIGAGGANTYTGGTLIKQGRLQLTNYGGLGAGTINVSPGGQLWITPATAGTLTNNLILTGIGSAEGTASFGAVRINTATTFSGTVAVSELTRIGLTGNATFTNVLSGSGDLELAATAAGPIFAIFTNPGNTFNGRWIVKTGAALAIAGDAPLGPVPTSVRNDAIVLDGGRLQQRNAAGTATANITINANRGISLPNSGVTGYLHSYTGGTITVAGPISGPGNISKTDGGNVSLTGVSPMTGTLGTEAGILALDSGATLPNLSTISITGGTMQLNSGSSVNVLGTTRLVTGTLQINAGSTLVTNRLVGTDASSGASVITQSGGDVVITGATNAGNNTNSILFGHWPSGSTTYNMNGGTFNALGAIMYLGHDSGATYTQTSGVSNVLGVNFNNGSSTGTRTLNLNGGRLNIGASGIVGANVATKVVNLGAGTLGASANWSSSQDMTLTNAATGVTIDTALNNITLSGLLSGTGRLTKEGSGTLSLTNTGNQTYAGTTTVNAGTLIVSGTLANNGSANILMAAPDATLAGNPMLTRAIAAGVNTYAGFGSKVTATSLDPVLVTSSLQTTATILMSGDNLTANNMSMQWRTRTTAEAAAGNTNGIISDVLSLTDMGTDLFVLQMSYDQSASGMEDSIESAMAASGILRLGWKNGPTATDWTTATVGNNGNNTQGSLGRHQLPRKLGPVSIGQPGAHPVDPQRLPGQLRRRHLAGRRRQRLGRLESQQRVRRHPRTKHPRPGSNRNPGIRNPTPAAEEDGVNIAGRTFQNDRKPRQCRGLLCFLPKNLFG
jgi:fibronectin-binding autotransporter adhesin